MIRDELAQGKLGVPDCDLAMLIPSQQGGCIGEGPQAGYLLGLDVEPGQLGVVVEHLLIV